MKKYLLITSLISSILSANVIAKTTAEDLKQVQNIKTEMENSLNSFNKKYKDKTYTRGDIDVLSKSLNKNLESLKSIANQFEPNDKGYKIYVNEELKYLENIIKNSISGLSKNYSCRQEPDISKLPPKEANLCLYLNLNEQWSVMAILNYVSSIEYHISEPLKRGSK